MRRMDRDTEAAIDELYAAPPDQFVSVRNELAKRLGANVKSLAKPTLSAWTVNQLYRRHRAEFGALLEAGARLDRAQRDLMRGGGRAELDAASREERKLLERLTAHAREILKGQGRAATSSTVERVVDDLRALSRNASEREAFRGRLTKDLSPPGLEALFGAGPIGRVAAPPKETEEPQPTKAAKAPTAERKPSRQELSRRKQVEQALAKARQSFDKANRAHDRLAERERTAEADADRARKRAAELEARAAEAAREAERAEREAERARHEADRAAEDATLARKAHDAARVAADAAETELNELAALLRDAERRARELGS
jgi:hypothetical protein